MRKEIRDQIKYVFFIYDLCRLLYLDILYKKTEE